MSIRRRICGAAMGLVVAAAGLSVGPAARAQSSADCTTGEAPKQMELKVTSPTGSEPRINASVPIDVEVTNTWSSPLPTDQPRITKITAQLLKCREGQVLPDESERIVTGSAKSLALKWTTDPIPTNGPFAVKVVATGNRDSSQTSTWIVPFSLAVAPKRPAGVTAQAEGGTVNISWSLRDQELDLVLYEVQRAAQGSGDYTTINDGVVAANVDSVKDSPGTGAWRYRVLAIRRGAGESDGIRSAPSSDATAEIAAPTTTGGSTGSGSGTTGSTAGSGSSTGGTGSTSGSTATTSRSAPGGASTINLSTYSGALAARRQTGRAGEPDTGFSETLPFTPRPAGSADELGAEGEGEGEEPMELGGDEPNQGEGQRLISDEGDRRRSLGFVAFGLLLFVLSMTGLFLKSEVKRAEELDPLDPLPPDGGGPSVRPSAPTPSPAPAPAPSPEPWQLPSQVAVHSPAPPPLEARPWALGAAAVAVPAIALEPKRDPEPEPEAEPAPEPERQPEPQPQPRAQVLAPPPPPPRRARRRSLPATAPLVPPAPPTDPAGFATDLSVVGFDDLSEPAAAPAPSRRRHRTVAPSDAPSLDVPDPVPAAPPGSRTTTRTRTPPHARRTPPRLPPRPADDRREGGPTVRPRRRRTGEGNRRLPVG